MRNFVLLCAAIVSGAAGVAVAQTQGRPAPLSPPAETTVTIAGKVLSIKYSAPSVRGRRMLGDDGVISKDPTYPVWRMGANAATAFHTDGDLTIKGLNVPKGDYTLYALVNTTPWQLIVNKQTGQWGLTYSQDQDLGRVPMDMSTPPTPIETHKITLSSTGANSGKLQVEFENYVASVPFTVK